MARHLERLVAAFAVLLLDCLVPSVAAAQHITIDGSLSAAQTLVGPNYTIGANLGKQVGGNLFHSFGIFGLSQGENATFSGPTTVTNVIGRVTGGTASSIDGAIKSSIAGANLYLINPSGIVFGPNATVNVSGSFHAATADYLRLSDGAKFQATNPSGSTLSAAAPAAFGFLTTTPPAITVNGSQLGVTAAGATLGIVAGPVTISNSATLSAPAGTIHVTSVAGTGEVPVDPANSSALTVTRFGPVSVSSSTLDVSDRVGLGSGGSVFIRADALTIDASEINGDNYGSGPGGKIVLHADSQITLSGGADVHAIAYSSGRGADVTISAGRLSLTAGALVESATAGAGNGGDISVNVSGQITIDGTAGPALMVGIPATGIASLSRAGGAAAGNITVSAGSLSIKTNGGIASSTFGAGASGNITIAVSGELSIDQSAAVDVQSDVVLGIQSQGNLGSTGKGGDVTISAGTLSLTASGQIGSAAFGAGDGGDLSISVAGLLNIDGSGSTLPFVSGLFASAQPGSTGNAGNLTVAAASLSLLNGGTIFNGAVGAFGGHSASTGNGGNVTVVVSGALTIDSSGQISTSTDVGTQGTAGNIVVTAGSLSITNSGVIASSTFGSGNGGNVSVAVTGTGPGALTILSNGIIAANTSGSGNGGQITVTVAGGLTIDGTSANAAFATGIVADAEAGSSGNAGAVAVTAGSVTILANGEISSSAFGSNANTGAAAAAGNAGDVIVSVAGLLKIDGTGQSGETGIFAQSNSTDKTAGSAGNITVSSGSLDILSDGTISSSTFGGGAGGSIAVTVAGTLSLDGTGQSDATGIFARSESADNTAGSAGKITVSSGTLKIITNGEIASSTFGGGAGGDVSVTVAGTLSIDGTRASGVTGIFAQSNSTDKTAGSAGNITVSSGSLDILSDGRISSSTFGGGAGGGIAVTVAGTLSIDGTGQSSGTGIFARSDSTDNTAGSAGNITVSSGTLKIITNGEIASSTFGGGAGGSVAVTVTGTLSIDGTRASGVTGIIAQSDSGAAGSAGNVTVTAGTLSIVSDGEIGSSAFGSGAGGNVAITVAGTLSIDGRTQSNATGIFADSNSTDNTAGSAGNITISSGTLNIISNGEISSSTFGGGAGGSIAVTVAGALSIDGTGQSSPTGVLAQSNSGAAGRAGQVTVTAGSLSIVDNGEIGSSTFGSGAGGNVTVTVIGTLSIDGTGQSSPTGIFAQSNSTGSTAGSAGNITVSSGALNITNNGVISSSTSGAGNGGQITVTVAGGLTIDGAAADTTSATGIVADAEAGSSGNAGTVTVTAGSLMILANGEISSSIFGANANTGAIAATGNAGDVIVTVAGLLTIDGSGVGAGIFTSTDVGTIGKAGNIAVTAGSLTFANSGVISSNTSGSGNGGNVSVAVNGTGQGALTILSNGGIAANTFGAGNGGQITVTVAGGLTIDGTSADAAFATGIVANAEAGSSGNAGTVAVTAGSLTILANGEISSSALGTNAGTGAAAATGNAGDVIVSVAGLLTIDGSGEASRITTSTGSGTIGNAGNIAVTAGSLSIANNGVILSSTSGSGNGGNVSIAVAGTLAIDSTAADPNLGTGISAQTNPASAGNGGDVRVQANAIILFGSGNQITAQAFGSGAAGNVTLRAVNLQILDGGGISAAGAQANGGNITLSAGDLLYLQQGSITTSSEGVKSNGGDITIGSPFVVLGDHSSITANAFGGNGGNIFINAGVFIASADNTAVTASSQTGIAGTIAISGQESALNSSLVVLPSALRSAAAILRDSCAARAGTPHSTLTKAGRGGLPQDPEATIPALYLAGRDVETASPAAAAAAPPRVARQSSLRLTMPCAD